MLAKDAAFKDGWSGGLFFEGPSFLPKRPTINSINNPGGDDCILDGGIVPRYKCDMKTLVFINIKGPFFLNATWIPKVSSKH